VGQPLLPFVTSCILSLITPFRFGLNLALKIKWKRICNLILRVILEPVRFKVSLPLGRMTLTSSECLGRSNYQESSCQKEVRLTLRLILRLKFFRLMHSTNAATPFTNDSVQTQPQSLVHNSLSSGLTLTQTLESKSDLK
jgi:hypothetical protein